MKKIVDLLHKELSYKIQGISFEVRKNFGLGHKEQIYQKAFEEELKRMGIPYEREKAIKIYSPKDGKFIGLYRPDFIVDKKIIVEMKTFKFVPKEEMRKIYDYLRNSKYELGYLINFASPQLYIKRVIFTNNRKDWFKKILVSVSILFVLFSGLTAQAAKLYLEPSEGEYYQGDTFIVKVKIDTENECINTVEAKIEFSQDILEPIDFSHGDSILSLWVKEPNFSVISCNEPGGSCGLVEFSGGIPGGYCGIIPGDPGESNLLCEIIFRAISSNITPISTQVAFQDNSQVLLNDGFGTSSKLTAKGAVFTISPEKLKPPKDEWQEEIRKDTILPEPFQIEVLKEPLMFEGKYFIIFQTLDKQTGLDYYEVKEGKKDWQKAESPYLLKDQALQSIIKVKAVDKAGNERIAEHSPLKITKKVTKKTLTRNLLIFIGLIIIAWIIKKYFFKWKITH